MGRCVRRRILFLRGLLLSLLRLHLRRGGEGQGAKREEGEDLAFHGCFSWVFSIAKRER